MSISLFKKEVAPYLPAKLKEYVALESTRTWFNKYAKLYRDSTVHRIAPYLPPKALTPEEANEWRRLEAESHNLLMGLPTANRGEMPQRLDGHEQMRAKIAQLGSNSLFIGLSLTGVDTAPLVQMHPQLLTDWMSVHELLKCFISGMREDRGLSVPNIPPIQVC